MDEHANKVVDWAQILSHLEPGSIWALFSVCLFGYLIWDRKDRMQKEDHWLEIRNSQIAEDAKQTEVMKRIVDEVASIKMMVSKYLIEKE